MDQFYGESTKASEFFQPYIDDLKTILESSGIRALESQREYFHQRQDVVDDVHAEMEVEARRPEARRKSYDALLHDAVLWHVVADRRNANADSPFDVEYWGVSIDWRLIHFDAKKRAKTSAKVPVILHPENLVQLLQFWVPRTSLLEDTLIDTIKLPLFFQSFDVEDESATLKVLEQLSRYENIDDLPEPVLRRILTNKILRARITQVEASNDEEAFVLVRDELIALHQKQAENLDRTKDELSSVSAELVNKEASYDKVRDMWSDSQSKFQVESEKNQTLGDKLSGEIQLRNEVEFKLAKARYLIYFILCPLFVAIIFGISSYIAVESIEPKTMIGWRLYTFVLAPSFLLPFLMSWACVGRYLERNRNLSDWWLSKFGASVGRGWWWLFGLAIVSIIQGFVWDSVKGALLVTS